MVIHYWSDNPVLRDPNNYNVWHSQITSEYYNIVHRVLGQTAPDCTNDGMMMSYLLEIMQEGGIYVNDTVIINHELHRYRRKKLTVAIRDEKLGYSFSNIAFMVAAKDYVTMDNIKNPDQTLYCQTSGEYKFSL